MGQKSTQNPCQIPDSTWAKKIYILCPNSPSIGSLVKLYAPEGCDGFFGIFQEYSMEYSIFQNFQHFRCDAIFLEYSWNIPYSKNIIFYVVMHFFWNIPYSHKLKNSCDGKKMEYSIFQKNKKKVVMVQKWNIKDSLLLGTKNIDIEGNMRRPNFRPFFDSLKYSNLMHFFGIFRNIPYSKKSQNWHVMVYFWNIPGIFHIPKKLRFGL